ncbi:MAG: NAD-glutamate dehydrogenase, partial [Inquilinus sp.]|nr:NAD-glutamate dehydrogenase [Inquilinus sp.]
MPPKAQQHKDTLIESVVTVLRQRVPKARADSAEAFLRLYFQNVPPDDLLSQEEDNLYGAALCLWQFSATRGPKEAKIRVYNPQYDEHAWHSAHTVVEIVNDDMPFLVDSVTAALNGLGLTVHLVIHPIAKVVRDPAGQMQSVHDVAVAPKDAIGESYMHIEVDEQTSAETLERIGDCLARVLRDTRFAVEDWRTMRSRVTEVTEEIAAGPAKWVPEDETKEAVEFLRWMDNDHFTYLGYREYAFRTVRGETQMSIVPDTGLGILREDDVSVFEGMLRKFSTLPPDVQQFVQQPRLLMVTKANLRSTVHRPVHLDVVVLKVFDDKGKVVGERMVVGLFTSVAYNRSASDIPFLRRKVSQLLARAEFEPRSHDGKALTHILDTYPRDELFQSSDDELLATALGVLHLQERQRTALFIRRDPYQRFVSCLVYTPRERYHTDLRKLFEKILEAAFNGTVTAYYTQFGEGVHARVQFIVKTEPGRVPEISVPDVEASLVQAGRTWADLLQDALVEAKGEEAGLTLVRRYGEAFPTSYREKTLPQAAIFDIGRVEEVIATGTIGLNLYRPIEAAENQI